MAAQRGHHATCRLVTVHMMAQYLTVIDLYGADVQT